MHLDLVWCDRTPFRGLIYAPFTWAPESGLADPARKWFVYDTLMTYSCCNIYIYWWIGMWVQSGMQATLPLEGRCFTRTNFCAGMWLLRSTALITTTLHLSGDVTANECQLMHTILSQIICSCTYYRTYMVCRSSLCSQEASLMTNAVYGVMLNYSSFRMAIPAYILLHAKGTLLLWKIYWSMAPRPPEFRYVNQCN